LPELKINLILESSAMKKTLLLIFGLLVVILGFIYYAQSPTLEEKDYNSVRKYDGESAGFADTLTLDICLA
jgi:hypothetical protein